MRKAVGATQEARVVHVSIYFHMPCKYVPLHNVTCACPAFGCQYTTSPLRQCYPYVATCTRYIIVSEFHDLLCLFNERGVNICVVETLYSPLCRRNSCLHKQIQTHLEVVMATHQDFSVLSYVVVQQYSLPFTALRCSASGHVATRS